jgi:hypothetical protein
MIKDRRTALLASLHQHLRAKLKDRMEAAIRMADLLLRISNVHVGYYLTDFNYFVSNVDFFLITESGRL